MLDYDQIISDTSPLFYLEQIDLIDVLPELFGQVVVPEAVLAELAAGEAQGERVPALKQFSWIVVHSTLIPDFLRAYEDLGQGELEAMALALTALNPLMLLDDRRAREVAALNRIKFTGTLGILLRAKSSDLIPTITPLINELQRIGFRLTDQVKGEALALAREA